MVKQELLKPQPSFSWIMLSTVFYNMSRPNTRPDTTHDHGQQLASMSGTAQPSHIALVSVVQEVSGNRAVRTEA